MNLLQKILAIVALSIVIIISVSSLVKAEGTDCENQCSPKFANTDGVLVCEQICRLNETNQAILDELKRIAKASEKVAGGN